MGAFRMLLALCVLLTHSASKDLHHLGGAFAVESFFVISGFYMALVLTEKYTRAKLGDSWVANFYLSRYLRLYPIYILSALAMLSLSVFALVLFGSASANSQAWAQLLSLPLSVSNVLLILWVIVANLTLFASSRASHFDQRLAEFSYPFYLFHPLALMLVHSTLVKRAAITNGYFIFACQTALTLVFAYLVLSLEARYVEPYRQRLGRPGRSLPVAAQ